MTRARQQAGWRMANIKELASLVDLGVSDIGSARIDSTAFPGASAWYQWSSTPMPGYAGGWGVAFLDGRLQPLIRNNSVYELRLVRSAQ